MSPSLCGRSAAHEPATSDGRSDGLQPFAVTAGAAASSPEPTPFYVFTWNSLSAISGLSPARPTGNSEHTCPVLPSWSGVPCRAQEGRLPRGGPSRSSVVRFIPPLWPDLVAFLGRRGGERVGLCGQRGHCDMGEVEAIGAGRLPRRDSSTRAPSSGERTIGDGLEGETAHVGRGSSPRPVNAGGCPLSQAGPWHSG